MAVAAVRAYATRAARGRIELVLGPMFSGKTTELLRRVHRFKLAGQNVLLLKSAKDTRGDERTHALTHDGKRAPAMPVTRLADAADAVRGVDVVGVDEGQFYEDLETGCESFAQQGKTVIVAALDGDYQRAPFLPVVRLVAKSDSVTKLLSVCVGCGTEAPFSRRLSKEQAVEVIGGADKYEAVCRACYASRN
eukprot:Amastigsp_a177261_13.p1 type:complete len:193 gc:universal Amastigsp_a177261_13:78-656(+)